MTYWARTMREVDVGPPLLPEREPAARGGLARRAHMLDADVTNGRRADHDARVP